MFLTGEMYMKIWQLYLLEPGQYKRIIGLINMPQKSLVSLPINYEAFIYLYAKVIWWFYFKNMQWEKVREIIYEIKIWILTFIPRRKHQWKPDNYQFDSAKSQLSPGPCQFCGICWSSWKSWLPQD